MIGSIDLSFILDILENNSGNIELYFASTEGGRILPHEVADNTLVFVDTKTNYEKGDLIIVRDEEIGDEYLRIKKARSNREKNFRGKFVLGINTFDKKGGLDGILKKYKRNRNPL